MRVADNELAAARREQARLRKAAAEEASDLGRIERQAAKYRKQNAAMRAQLDESSSIDEMRALGSEVMQLQQRLEAQTLENETLQRLLDRQREGVAAQGPSEAQRGEMSRLGRLVRELQRQLREEGKATVRGGRAQQAQHLGFAKLCERRGRMKRALDEGERALQNVRPACASPETLRRVEEAERALRGAKQQRRGQRKKHDVRVHDLKAEKEKLQQRLERQTRGILRRRVELGKAYDALGLAPPTTVGASLADVEAEVRGLQEESLAQEQEEARARVAQLRANGGEQRAQAREARRREARAAVLVQSRQRGCMGRARARLLREQANQRKPAMHPFGGGHGNGSLFGRKKRAPFGDAGPLGANGAQATVRTSVLPSTPFKFEKAAVPLEPPPSWRAAPKEVEVEAPRPASAEPPSDSGGGLPTTELPHCEEGPSSAPAPDPQEAPQAATRPRMGRRRRMLEDGPGDGPWEAAVALSAPYVPSALAAVEPPASAARCRPPAPDQGATVFLTATPPQTPFNKDLMAGGGSLGGLLAAARSEMSDLNGAGPVGSAPLRNGGRRSCLPAPGMATGPRLDFGTGPTTQQPHHQQRSGQKPHSNPASDPFAKKPLGPRPVDPFAPALTNPLAPPKAGMGSKALVPVPVPLALPSKKVSSTKLEAPGFTDDIDDAELEAEERAFLARMKGAGDDQSALPAARPAAAKVETAPLALPVPDPSGAPMIRGGAREELVLVDDLSDEELLP